MGQRIDFVPLDARLELPESAYSYLLQDWAGTLSVEHAFSRTAETLDMILGLSLPVDSLERMSRKTAEPVARHKRVWSSLTYDEGDLHVDAETEVFTWMTQEVDLRRRDAASGKPGPMVCVRWRPNAACPRRNKGN
ncbi:MAG: hypothetical protein IID44_19130 [Planctomycetes bacterium]|nr:hypothetical protein [Planctomycetota bacterium]